MVTAGMTPRDAVRQLEARLTAAGCPDADYDAAELFRLVTGRDVRLADAPRDRSAGCPAGVPLPAPGGAGAAAVPVRSLELSGL